MHGTTKSRDRDAGEMGRAAGLSRGGGGKFPARPYPRRMDALLCLCTCPDAATAERLAASLVEERLAACVSLVPGLRSIYRWQGAIQRDEELLLLIKTTRARYPALQARLPALHPYELPELLAVEVADGLPAYLRWLADATRPVE